jgi:hypothetical protein
MDYLAQQFVAATTKLRKTLSSLGQLLPLLREDIQKQIATIQKASDAADDRHKSPPLVRTELHIPDAEIAKQERDRKNKQRLECFRTFIEVLTLVAVAYYAVEARRQRHEMQKATTATQQAAQAAGSSADTAARALVLAAHQFRTQERPYLWAEPRASTEDGKIFFPLGKDATGKETWGIGVAVAVYNSGRSPAINMISTHSEIKIGVANEVTERVRNFIPQYPNVAGSILTPGNDVVVPSQRPLIFIPQNQIDGIRDGTWMVYIVGRVKYNDIFEPPIPPYETTYCFRINNAGLPFGDCPFGISMK